jgi:hypothetical protein
MDIKAKIDELNQVVENLKKTVPHFDNMAFHIDNIPVAELEQIGKETKTQVNFLTTQEKFSVCIGLHGSSFLHIWSKKVKTLSPAYEEVS